MNDLTEAEMSVLGCFSGGCEAIGKVRRVNDSVWFDLEHIGLITRCDCCDDPRSFVITEAGEKAIK